MAQLKFGFAPEPHHFTPKPHHFSPITVPDLTDKIIRQDNQYCVPGGFGDVFQCHYIGDDGVKEVAVKAFRFDFSVGENNHDERKVARMIRRELGIWRRLNHPNIVPFLGTICGFGRQGSTALVSVWMPNGTLHTFLEAHADQLVIVDRLQLLLDITKGLDYLHSFPFVHGNLTSNNVLLDRSYNACLTDFGCASLVGELPEGLTYLNMTTMSPGTLRWAAPELIQDEPKHTTKSDIYSFGNLALLVLSGKYPWSEVRSDAVVVLQLSQGLKPARPLAPPIDDGQWKLIERCWSSTQDRPLTGDLVYSLRQLCSAAQVSGTVGFLGRISNVTGGGIPHPSVTRSNFQAITSSDVKELANHHQDLPVPSSSSITQSHNGPPLHRIEREWGLSSSVKRDTIKTEINVIFVGQTGVGKSSLINMIMGVPDGSITAAQVSNDARPCTIYSTSYAVSLSQDLECQLWDTRGLDEAAGIQSSFVARLVDKIRQLASQQARELKETLRDRTRLATPIIVWCIDATKVDVDVHWQQFEKVYVEYCERKAIPVVVITRGPPRDGWRDKCAEQIQRLNLGVDVPIRMVRKYRTSSSPEYGADSKTLKDFISDIIRRVIPEATHHYRSVRGDMLGLVRSGEIRILMVV